MIVAKELLGKKLTRKIGNYEISGIISETEAYRHKDDPASHAFRSITNRNKVMFGEVGIAYVYFTYGMHYCFNVVAKKMKTPAGAVLIRGIIPKKGIKKMQEIFFEIFFYLILYNIVYHLDQNKLSIFYYLLHLLIF